MKRLAIIPARGGSKRIPRKNIKLFLGEPIISYSIRAAKESGLFDVVMVSTDDEEIKEVAIHYGASVPFIRSKKNSDDYATTIDVISEVILDYEKIGCYFHQCACIYPSAPFITSETLRRFHKELELRKLDCIFPALQYSYPIQRSLRQEKDFRMAMNFPEHLITRSQDLEKNYHDAGQFYFFNLKPLLSAHKLWTENTGFLVISQNSAQDIDEQEDWELAEFKFEFLKEKGLL